MKQGRFLPGAPAGKLSNMLRVDSRVKLVWSGMVLDDRFLLAASGEQKPPDRSLVSARRMEFEWDLTTTRVVRRGYVR